MIYTFRVLNTPVARMRMGLKTNDIMQDIVTEAEKLSLETNDSAIYDLHDLGLKVVVRFGSRTIHVMTCEEATKAGLPGSA